jgi:hypothetical protein
MNIQDSASKQEVEVESMRLNESYKLLGLPLVFDGNSLEQVKMMEKM